METELKKCFRWEIDNLLSDKKEDVLESEPFSSGGCEWFLRVLPKGFGGGGHLTTCVDVYDPCRSLRFGWKRRVKFAIVFLNESGKELSRWGDTSDRCFMFCAGGAQWSSTLPLPKLEEKGFLDTKKLTIEVYMKVLEAFNQGKSTDNDLVEFNGVQVLSSQVISFTKIHSQHPHFFLDYSPTKQLHPLYFALFFCLIETLGKSPQSLSLAELTNAQVGLTELTKAGFKLDFLNSKLAELSLERKKAVPHVQQLTQRIKNVELTLTDLKAQLHKEKIKSAAKVSSFQFINFIVKRFFLSCFSI